ATSGSIVLALAGCTWTMPGGPGSVIGATGVGGTRLRAVLIGGLAGAAIGLSVLTVSLLSPDHRYTRVPRPQTLKGQKPRVSRQPRSGPLMAEAVTSGTSAAWFWAAITTVPTREPAGNVGGRPGGA